MNVLCTCVGWERESCVCVCVCACVCVSRGGGILKDGEKEGVMKRILVLNSFPDLTNVLVFPSLRRNPLPLSAFTVGKIPEPRARHSISV